MGAASDELPPETREGGGSPRDDCTWMEGPVGWRERVVEFSLELESNLGGLQSARGETLYFIWNTLRLRAIDYHLFK